MSSLRKSSNSIQLKPLHFLRLLPIGVLALLASCSSLPVPGQAGAGVVPSEEARSIMKRSAAAHGDPWGKYREVEVAFVGEWTMLASRLQPVLTDPGFRKSSVETYHPATGAVRQVHTGPMGTKTVECKRPEIRVALNGLESTRGADVDVVFSDFQKATDGSVWPAYFLESIQRPFVAKAHEWRMTSLKLNGKAAKF